MPDDMRIRPEDRIVPQALLWMMTNLFGGATWSR